MLHVTTVAALCGSLLSGLSTVAPLAAAVTRPSLLPAAGQYFPVAPVQVLDTRNGTGGVSGPLAAGATAVVQVTGVGAVPAAGVSDVYVVVNAIGTASNGCLDDYNSDVADPGICAVSFDAGNNVSDSDIVAVSDGGKISVTNTSSGADNVAITVMGYYQNDSTQTAGDTYVSLPLKGIVDTRLGLGAPDVQIPAGGILTVQIAGNGGVPANATGAALYIGAANASTTGTVSAYPAGGTPSTLSLLSYVPGQAVRDLYFGALSSSGQLTLQNNGSQPVDLMVGVQGYLAGPSATTAGTTYVDVPEQRIVDTRTGTGVAQAQVPAGGSITFAATGTDGVPSSGVSATAESVRAMNATSTGFLTIYAAGTPDPNSPAVNFYAGGNQGNGLTADSVSPVGTTGQQTITNHSSGTIDIVVTLRGYYASPTAPAAPDSVGYTVSGSTATVTWMAPLADGGSPVTSYTVTAPPDSASVTVDSATYQATLSGLANAAADTFKVTATNAVGTSVTATSLDGPSTATFSEDTAVSVDPSTGAETLVGETATVTTTDSNGVTTTFSPTVDTSTVFTDVNSLNGQACDLTKINGVTPYTHKPFSNSATHNSFSSHWINHLYSIGNATKQAGVSQWEAIQCTVGGAQTWNNWDVTLAEDDIFTDSTNANTLEDYKVGQKITSASEINRTVGFELGFDRAGATASVHGGESVTLIAPNAALEGGLGADGHWGSSWPSYFNKYNPVRVDAEWIAYNGDGYSPNFEGNVGIALDDYPMGTGPHIFHSFHLTRGHCMVFGIGVPNCPSWY